MKKTTLLLVFIFLAYLISAQTVVKGIVTDADSADPLIGATIIVEGTTTGVTTDENGNFRLNVPQSAGTRYDIVVSYTGYTNQKINITVNNGSEIEQNIRLKSDLLQLQDVVVSANKRSEAAQKVPMSISTLSPVEIQRTGAFKAQDYFSAIPNLSLSASGGGGASFGDGRSSGRSISIRGVSGSNTTAMYLDDTPLPQFADPLLFDINRVEVLRGPQGSLYGSSTMGGAVKVITNSPNVYKIEGNIEGNVAKVKEGNADYNLQGVLNVPIVKEKMAIRVGGFYNGRSGVYDRIRQTHFNGFPLNTSTGATVESGKVVGADPFTGAPIPITILNTPQKSLAWADGQTRKDNVDSENSYGLNAALGFYPSKNISIIPKIILQNTKGNGYDFADIKPNNFTQYRTAGLDENYTMNLSHYSLLSKFKFASGELVNSLSYSQIHQSDLEDVSEVQSSGGGGSKKGPPFGLRGGSVFPEAIERFGDLSKTVEELRYASALDGKFNFIVGAFLSNEKSKFNAYQERQLFLETIGETSKAFYTQDTYINTDEYALFGEGYFALTPKLKATLGFRAFKAKQSFNQLIGGFVGDYSTTYTRNNKDESGFNPKLNLTYNIDEHKVLYAGASRGFRLGGGNPFVPIIYAADDLKALGLTKAPDTYGSDYIWSYELGSKNAFLNNRLFLNAAVFHNVWDKLQQRVFLSSGYLFLDNVGSASITGFEFDLKGKASKNIVIGAAMGLADAQIKEGSKYTGAEAGDRILNVPAITASGNFEYSHPIGSNTDKSMYYRIDIQHTGERVNTFDPENNPEFVFAPFTLVNARIGYTNKVIELALFGKNIFNQIANFGDVTSLGATPFGRVRYATSRPASFGISIRYNFDSLK